MVNTSQRSTTSTILMADLKAQEPRGLPAAKQMQMPVPCMKKPGKPGVDHMLGRMGDIIDGNPAAVAQFVNELTIKNKRNDELRPPSSELHSAALKTRESSRKAACLTAGPKASGQLSRQLNLGSAHPPQFSPVTLASVTVGRAREGRRQPASTSKPVEFIRRTDCRESLSPSGVRAASDRAKVLRSIDSFDLNLQRHEAGVSSSSAAFDVQSCSVSSHNIEQVLQSMMKKLPSKETQRHFNARFMQRLHAKREAQESACIERARGRQRLLLEHAQRCKDALNTHVGKSIVASANTRSLRCKKLVSTVYRARQYERVVKCNLEVQKLLLKQEEEKLAATRQRHEQQAAATRSHLTEAAIEEQARICRSVHAIRRALKRSQLIAECEVMAEEIINLVFTASDFKERLNTNFIPPKVWRGWLEHFVATEEGAPTNATGQPDQGAPPAGVLIDIPATPPAVCTPQLQGRASLAPLPASFLSEFRDYAQAEGSWSSIQEASSFQHLPSLPPLGDYLASVLQHHEAAGPTSTTGAPAQEQTGVAAAESLEEEEAEASGACNGGKVEPFKEPQLEMLGQLVACLLQEASTEGAPNKPPGVPQVPLRVIVTGKPASGKHALARQLASRYELEVLCLQSIVEEALNAASAVAKQNVSGAQTPRLNEVSTDPVEDVPTSFSPGPTALCALGAEASRHLAAGEPLPDELAERPEEQLRRLLCCGADAGGSAACRSSNNTGGASSSSSKAAASASSKKTKGGKQQPVDKGSPSQEAGAAPEALRCGWVLVGFPTTAQQYALLEERLSGYVEAARRQPQRLQVLKERSAFLTLQEGCADLHVLLDIPVESILRGVAATEEGPLRAQQQQVATAYNFLIRVGLLDLIFAFEAHQGFVEEFAKAFGSEKGPPRLLRVVTPDTAEAFGAVSEKVSEVFRLLLFKPLTTKIRFPPNAFYCAARERQSVLSLRQQTAQGEEPEERQQRRAFESLSACDTSAAPPLVQQLDASVAADAAWTSRLAHLEAEEKVFLVEQWESLVSGYIQSLAQAFSWIHRSERSFSEALVSLQCHFAFFLQNPASSENILEKFCRDYNETVTTLGPSLKLDAIKEELHVRIEDVCEALWQQEEKSRQQASKERKQLLEAGWVDAFSEVLAAQLAMIIETEVVRYWALEEFAVDCLYTLMGLSLPDRQLQKQAEAELPSRGFQEAALRDVNAALRALWKSDSNASSPPPTWKIHPFEGVETVSLKALLPLDLPQASSQHSVEEKRKAKFRDSSSGGSGSRRSEAKVREGPQQQSSWEHQLLEMLHQELQVQVQYRIRKACLWAAAALLRLAGAACSLSSLLEDWSVAHSLARQEVVGALGNKLRDAVEEGRRIEEELSIQGVQLLVKRGLSSHSVCGFDDAGVKQSSICFSPSPRKASFAFSPPQLLEPRGFKQQSLQQQFLLQQLINDLLIAHAGNLFVPSLCVEEILRGRLFAPREFGGPMGGASGGPPSSFVPSLRLPGGSVDCVEFLISLLLKDMGGPPSFSQLRKIREAVPLSIPLNIYSKTTECVLSLPVSLEQFRDICRGRWLPLQQHQHQQQQQQNQQEEGSSLVPSVVYKIVAAFDAAVPTAEEQQRTLAALGLGPSRAPQNQKESNFPCEAAAATAAAAKVPAEAAATGPAAAAEAAGAAAAGSDVAQAPQQQVTLRKLLSYLCLSEKPSSSLKHLLLFLASDQKTDSTNSSSSSSSNSNSNKSTSGSSSDDAAAAAEPFTDMDSPIAALEHVYCLCCGLGFRGPPWGLSPVALLPFEEFASAAAEEGLIIQQPQQEQEQQQEGVEEIACAPVAQPHQQQKQQMLLKEFLKSKLFDRVLVACGAVYTKAPLASYFSSLGL
ncbi:hypothetical protein Esti_004346 [Eimeria stiedai]